MISLLDESRKEMVEGERCDVLKDGRYMIWWSGMRRRGTVFLIFLVFMKMKPIKLSNSYVGS